METIGGLSGATLGYIVGNLPGAYQGYRIGRYYGRTMPPITRFRARAGRRILSAMRGWRRRGYPSGSTERILGGMARGRMVRRRANNVVTQQKDYGTQYYKKKAPRRFRRQWKKFVKKVTAVEISNAALKTVVFNNRIQSQATPGKQNCFSMALYGYAGGADDINECCGYEDVIKILDNEPGVTQQGVGSPPTWVPSNGKIHFNTGVLDITLRNIMEVDAEVDVYYGYHVTDSSRESYLLEDANHLSQEFKRLREPTPIKSGNTEIKIIDRGVTPFDMSKALSTSGFHIIKKQKFLMEPGKSVFIQHRDAKNHEIDAAKYTRNSYYLKKITYEVLVVHKASVSGSELSSTIIAGVTRKYNYTVIAGTNQPRNALQPILDPAP